MTQELFLSEGTMQMKKRSVNMRLFKVGVPAVFITVCLLGNLKALEYNKTNNPIAFVRASEGGGHYFKLITGSGKGQMYRVSGGKRDKLLWEIQGCRAANLFVVDRHRFDFKFPEANALLKGWPVLIRLESFPKNTSDVDNQVGVAFYRNGKIFKEHKISNLMIDKRKIDRWSHGYFWAETWKLEDSAEQSLFYLTTKDRVRYVFSVKTGEVIEKRSSKLY